MWLRILQVPNCFYCVVLAWVFTHSACLGRLKREFLVNFERESEENVFMAYFAISHIGHILIGSSSSGFTFYKSKLNVWRCSTLQVILWSLHAQCAASWDIFGNKILDVCDVVLLVLERYPFLCIVVFFFMFIVWGITQLYPAYNSK